MSCECNSSTHSSYLLTHDSSFLIMPESLFLGLDVGTSGVKALLVAADGEVVRGATAPLSLSTPRAGWAEQDPEAWWEAAVGALGEVLAGGVAARVAGIGISGQMHSSV